MEESLKEIINNICEGDEYKKMKELYGELSNSDEMNWALLIRNDEKSLYAAISIVLLYRSQEVSSISIEVYILCLNKLLPVLDTHTIEIEFKYFIHKFNDILFNLSISFSEKNLIINQLLKMVRKFANIMIDTAIKDSLLENLSEKNKYIERFSCDTRQLSENLNPMEIDEWKMLIISIFEKLWNIQGNETFDTINSFCLFMENFVNNLFLESEAKSIMINHINKHKEVITFPLSNQISNDIDKGIIFPIFNSTQNSDDLKNQIRENALKIKENYKECIRVSLENYYNSPIHANIDTQIHIILVINNFLEKCHEDFVVDYFKDQHNLGKFCMSLSNQIQILSHFPLHIQNALCGLFLTLNEYYSDVIGYMFKKLNRNLKYEAISSDWATDFIDRAANPPFSDILAKFNTSGEDLRCILQAMTHNIILIEMPKFTSGLTLISQIIAIKLFKQKAGAKGASFIVYLHELAHYLQRIKCNTVLEAGEKKSLDNFRVSEGGNLLEETLFGKVLDRVSIPAAQFTISCSSSISLEDFQRKFDELNANVHGVKYINLKSSRDFIYLGSCGSKY